MSADELSQLIRMAQVLRIRSGILARELQAKHGPLAGKALKVEDVCRTAERKLIEIADSLNGARSQGGKST